MFSGLLLGLWVHFWRHVKAFFHYLGQDRSQQHQGTVYRKLPAGTNARNLLAT